MKVVDFDIIQDRIELVGLVININEHYSAIARLIHLPPMDTGCNLLFVELSDTTGGTEQPPVTGAPKGPTKPASKFGLML